MKLQLRPNIVFFSSGKDCILNTPNVTLRFYDAGMNAIFNEVLQNFRNGAAASEVLASLGAKFGSLKVQKCLDVLEKYDLFQNAETNLEQKIPVQILSIEGYLYHSMQKSIENFGWNLAQCSRSELLDLLSKSGTEPSEGLDIILLQGFDKILCQALSNTYRAQKSSWMLFFENQGTLTALSFCYGVSPCLTCLGAPSIGGEKVDQILFDSTEKNSFSVAAKCAFVLSQIGRTLENKDQLFATTLDIKNGETTRVRRFRNPSCAMCTQGPL